MKVNALVLRCSVALVLLSGLRLPSAPSLVQKAHAVVGLPATPASVAGVARRTTRRTVAVVGTSTAVAASTSAAASQQQAAAAQQQAAAAQQAAAQAGADAAAAEQRAAAAEAEASQARQQAAQAQQAAALPPGTVVSALPAGCTTLNLGGVDYFNCAGTYYRAAFQSDHVVYVVSKP
jgi:hypothetical protein